MAPYAPATCGELEGVIASAGDGFECVVRDCIYLDISG